MIRQEEFELWRDQGDERPLIIRGEARLPENPKGAVVICHGFKGFAHFSFFPYVAEKLAEAGFRAITFDFSGSGVGEDRENFTNPEAFTHNTYRQELEDIEAVVSEARVHDWIDDGYGIFGHSRGGGVAILHAQRDSRVKTLVTWAAISTTNRWNAELVAKWRETGFTNIENARTKQTIPLSTDILHEVEHFGETLLNIPYAASRIKAPWLILHGAQDETVPSSEAERLSTLSDGVSTLRIVEGTDHSLGGKHPLPEIITPMLEQVTRETVEFYSANMPAV
ncbi:MAG TPA: alpha/beta fold hydrolase [Gemmatimonadaceae bacterium]|nr:alpha/beta fold hydrolase [Gemmatimonadaceae bacterium]